MGLSSLPTQSEGMFTIIIVNTVVSISILKQILDSILQIVGIRLLSPPENGSGHLTEPNLHLNLADRFRSRFKPVRFKKSDWIATDCLVCLGRFEPEAVVSRLPCEHVFHKACVETWLEYDHATCPLCRTHVLDEGAWF